MSERQVILITGSSSGFGRMAAEDLARRGHTVFATMRGVSGKNQSAATSLRELAESENLSLHIVELDVTDNNSVNAAIQSVIDEAGYIDVLVNNAGVGAFGMVETHTMEQTEQVFDVNVMGILRVNRAVLPHMRERGSGFVVYLSSGLGRVILPFVGVYSASKWAVEALGETSHYELSPLGIDTTIIQPGAYGTDFGANMQPASDQERFASYGPVTGMAQQFGAAFEAQEFGDPQEVVDALVTVIEKPAGQRPLRVAVGADMAQGVEAINQTAAQVQTQVLSGMGMQ